MNEDCITERIARELADIGVRPGGVLLVHSSLRSLGEVPGGPETVIRGLLSALGGDGTLLIPALSYKHVDESHPVFDANRTASNVGAIPEYFRTRAGTIRSVHPTHSICGTGKLAGELLRNHHLDCTPVGPNSPLSRVPDRNGQILMLGCGLLPNTSMHGIEELVEPAYLFAGTCEFRLIHPDGSETVMRHRRHGFQGWVQRYDRIGPLLADEGMRLGKVLNADVHLIESRLMWDRGLEALRKDPLYFVDPE